MVSYKDKVLDLCNKMDKTIDNIVSKYRSIKDNDEDTKDIYDEIMDYKKTISEFRKLDKVTEDDYEDCEETYDDLEMLIDDLYDAFDEVYDNDEDHINSTLLKISNEQAKIDKKKKDIQEEIDRLKKTYGLTDDKIELVEKGIYYPWNFEKEGNLESGIDYYADSDNK